MDLGPFRAAVKKRMEEGGLNQSDLARMLEGKPAFPNFPTAQKWLSKYLLGGSDPPALPLLSVCQVLKIPLAEIGLPEPPQPAGPDRFSWIAPPESATIPVIAFSGAETDESLFTDQGYPVGAGDEAIPRPPGLDDPNAFGVRVHGDSMQPKYKQGDVVFVDTRKRPVNGDFAVVGLKTHERLVKRWHRSGQQVRLESVNPAHEPIVVPYSNIKFAFKIVWTKEG